MNALCERAHDKSNLTAYVGVAARWGNPGTQGGKYNLEIRGSRHTDR